MKKLRHRSRLTDLAIVLIVTGVFTACGSPPLVMPQEGDGQPETAIQSAQTPQETKTVEEGGGITNSPLPTPSPQPTATSLGGSPTLTPSPPTTTPSTTQTPPPPTSIPPEGSPTLTPPQPTTTPSTTQTPPSPTSVPPGEPEQYTFGTPELILTHNFIEIVDWVPGSNDELLIRNFEDDKFLVEILNVNTGQHQRLVETPNTIVGDPVILPGRQQIAYLAYDEANMINLYVNDLQDLRQGETTLLLNDVRPPIVPNKARENALVFDAQMSKLLNTHENVGATRFTLPTPLPFQEGGLFARYQTARNDVTDWADIHNGEKFLLLNRETGEVRNIDLGNGPGDWGPLGAVYAAWSPDGRKLAIIAAPEAMNPPVPFTQLLILSVNTNEIELIEDDFTFISNAVWAPDGHQLLISAVVGSVDGSNTNALFLIDSETMQITPLSIMPEGAFGLVPFRSLIWSPDGTTIIVGYTEDPTEGRWYKVSVKNNDYSDPK